MLEATGLAKTYRVSRGPLRAGAALRALDGVDFTAVDGETLAIVGESGSGKSTLSRLVCGLEEPSAGGLRMDGAPLRADPRLVQMVFQDPYGSLNPRKTALDLIAEPLRINTALDATARATAARDIMRKVGLAAEHERRYPHMFSGGQRQRIAIARALVLRPRVLIADEPVSALDVSIRSQVLNLLMDLRDEFRLCLILVSHDLHVVRYLAHTMLVMYLGRAVEQGPAAAIFARPLHPYTRVLLASTPTATIGKRPERIRLRGEIPSPLDPPAGCALHVRCPFAIDRCRAERPLLRELDGRTVACHRADDPAIATFA
ncbi:MAG: dipeptide ABC transporter ATP-binding protein [Alphaproteobacteria bacterium]|nr:dipeptide ABC transporter ATP-binding protein [Alphaproteobacteria bacterium]